MKPLRCDLPDDESHQDGKKQCGPDEVTAIVSVFIGMQERHRHRVAAGLAERRRQDLYDPEGESDFRDFAQHPIIGGSHIRYLVAWSRTERQTTLAHPAPRSLRR